MAVQKKDLRIGNKVMYLNTVFTVTQLFKGEAYLEHIDGGYGSHKYTSIEPVDLSEDVLLKCGFKYGVVNGVSSFEEDNRDDENTYYWDLKIMQSDSVDYFTFSLVKWGQQEYFTFSFQLLRVRIKYVHELQNLIYALTKKELEIQL
jgi:hypothetical protein